MKQWQLFYVFITFSIGMASLGIIAFASHKTKEKFVRYYLYFHIAFTLGVLSRMFFLYLHISLPGIPPSLIGIMEYVEGFITRYALMISIPIFLHEFLAVPRAKKRNVILGAIIGIACAFEHILEFAGWDETSRLAARVLDDAMFTAILLYVVLMGFYYAPKIEDSVKKKLALRITMLVGICLPALIDSLWFHHAFFPTSAPVFPLVYSGISIMFTLYLLTQVLGHTQANDVSPEALFSENISDISPAQKSNEVLFQQYKISPREQDVVDLVLEGRSNQDIGDALYISLSTVKTHLRNIYQKAEVKSRYELIALFKQK